MSIRESGKAACLSAIRTEHPGDADAIAEVITAAFAGAAHAGGNEAAIVASLREAGGLTLSLVAVENEAVVGHVALSRVSIDGLHGGWFGLGPLAVRPDRQRRGIGSALVKAAMAELTRAGAAGCVLLGDPAYYGRFGFAHDPAFRYPGPPARYFQRLVFKGQPPTGEVAYHPAFG